MIAKVYGNVKKRWGMYNNWNYYPVGFLWSEQLKMLSYSTYPFSLWSTLSISAVTSVISALRRCNKLVKNIVRQRQLIKPWNNPQNKLQLPRLHRLETFTLHSRAELLQKICPVSTEILIILIFIKEEYSCSVTIAWGLNMINNWSYSTLMLLVRVLLVRVVLNIVVDPGEGPGTRPTPPIFRPKWGQRAKKNFFETGVPLLSEGLDPPLKKECCWQ